MSNVSERKCDLPQLDLECLLLKAGVPLKHWGEYFSLVYEGTPRSEAARSVRGQARLTPPSLTQSPRGTLRSLGFDSRRKATGRPASSLRVLWPLRKRNPLATV